MQSLNCGNQSFNFHTSSISNEGVSSRLTCNTKTPRRATYSDDENENCPIKPKKLQFDD